MSGYGRLTILERLPGRKARCQCECGTIKVFWLSNVTTGKSTSCGCYRDERVKEVNSIHGMTRTRTHRSWCGIKTRCFNQTSQAYDFYGGRGISICGRWLNSFEAFLQDMGECPDGMTLERKDNDGDYTPSNCKWATRQEQALNRRTAKLITLNGVTMNQSAWSEMLGIAPGTIERRLKRGWSVRKTLTTPSRAAS